MMSVQLNMTTVSLVAWKNVPTPFLSPGVWYAHVGLVLLLLLSFGLPNRARSAVFSKYI